MIQLPHPMQETAGSLLHFFFLVVAVGTGEGGSSCATSVLFLPGI